LIGWVRTHDKQWGVSYDADLQDVISRHVHVNNAVIAFVEKMNIDNNAKFSEKDMTSEIWIVPVPVSPRGKGSITDSTSRALERYGRTLPTSSSRGTYLLVSCIGTCLTIIA
jgi:hypothetical protein